MRFVYIKVIILFSLISCTNINFLLDEGAGSDFLKNKTSLYISGWENPIIKEMFFFKFGKVCIRIQCNTMYLKRGFGKVSEGTSTWRDLNFYLYFILAQN